MPPGALTVSSVVFAAGWASAPNITAAARSMLAATDTLYFLEKDLESVPIGTSPPTLHSSVSIPWSRSASSCAGETAATTPS